MCRREATVPLGRVECHIDHDSYTPKVNSNCDGNCIRRIAVYAAASHKGGADGFSIQYLMEIEISGIFLQRSGVGCVGFVCHGGK
jgi:hypothetical protein